MSSFDYTTLDREQKADLLNKRLTNAANPDFTKEACYSNTCELLDQGFNPREIFEHITNSINEAKLIKLKGSMWDNTRISGILDVYAEIQRSIVPLTAVTDGSVEFFRHSSLDVVGEFLRHHNPHPESNTIQAMKYAGIYREEIKELTDAYLLSKKIEDNLSAKAATTKKVMKI